MNQSSPVVFVDTGFWLGLVNRDDAYHRAALHYMRTDTRRRVTTTGVLLELGNGATRGGRHLVIPLLQAVVADPATEIVPVDVPLLALGQELYAARPDKDWGLTDCGSFIVMQQRGIRDALSADRHFVQAGFRALLLEPW